MDARRCRKTYNLACLYSCKGRTFALPVALVSVVALTLGLVMAALAEMFKFYILSFLSDGQGTVRQVGLVSSPILIWKPIKGS